MPAQHNDPQPLNLDGALFLDLETTTDGRLQEIGAVLGDHELRRKAGAHTGDALFELESFSHGARVVVGHNVLDHDLPLLRRVAPRLRLHGLPVLDTLYLSPLAFPENPYHGLVKWYKQDGPGTPQRLGPRQPSDPVEDCKQARELLLDEYRALGQRYPASRGMPSVFRCLLGADTLADHGGLAILFQKLGSEDIGPGTAGEILEGLLLGEGDLSLCCSTSLRSILEESLADPAAFAPLAFVSAWLLVAGDNSVIPHWVSRRFPTVFEVVVRLRDDPCNDASCAYCRHAHDPKTQLQAFFPQFRDFRPAPADSEGRSLQEQIVTHALSGSSHLAILPTGGGKSLCFQLPALVRHRRRGVLTIVISPLQALMKDQVEGLIKRTGTHAAATLNGLLTPPERAQVLDGIRLGDVGLLYVSPEQLRNTRFRKAVRQREIGAFVFDEAHCLSKWGHDFRPDYLYAARFIRELAEEQGKPRLPSICCFTATARLEVQQELVEHFRKELGIELRVFEARDLRRKNLSFKVEQVAPQEKELRVLALIGECLASGDGGGVLVFRATRAATEATARFLRENGLRVEAYHAGLTVPVRKEVQDRFLQNEIDVICATCAFGMGVDKENVRLVLHADIPGSLENYLQEAGRAGRDDEPARCVLLYCPEDVDTQFRIEGMSRLRHGDVVQILRGVRRATRRQGQWNWSAARGADFEPAAVITAGELLRDPGVDTSFDEQDRNARTKVVAAVSWLERARFLQRDENRVSVFSGHPRVLGRRQADEILARSCRSDVQRELWMSVLQALWNAEPDEGLSVDDLCGAEPFRRLMGEGWPEEPLLGLVEQPRDRVAERPTAYHPAGRPTAAEVSDLVLRILEDMVRAGLLEKGLQLTAFLRYQVKDHSEIRLGRAQRLEVAMLDLLRETAPTADTGDPVPLDLRQVNQGLIHREEPGTSVEALRQILESLSQDGRGDGSGRLRVRQRGRDRYVVGLMRSWEEIVELAELRHAAAKAALDLLLEKVPSGSRPSAELLVEFSLEDVGNAIRRDLVLRSRVRDPHLMANRALLYLHEQEVIILQQGLAVFRQAMTVQLFRKSKGRKYTQQDFAPLAAHQEQRKVQVHVMDLYAQLGSSDGDRAEKLAEDYFRLDHRRFLDSWLPDRKETLIYPCRPEDLERIVTGLRHPAQEEVVTARVDQNLLVLAGPGSGKTRVVVHRCAYLLLVERADPGEVLVLCFNRSTALELRRRLADLVGDLSRHVRIFTYHGIAMRLAGRSFARRRGQEAPTEKDFEEVMREAVRMISADDTADETDDLRERLLLRYRHILVDEYQDIDELQYQLIAAIAGRRLEVPADEDDPHRLTILAVGDDDQNIYAWRQADVRFLHRFEADYGAERRSLLWNFRSTKNIIAASQQLIAAAPRRMKAGQVLTVEPGREPAGPGERVQRILVEDAHDQACAAAAELLRLREHDGSWTSFAVLARNWHTLFPVRAALENQDIPAHWARSREQAVPLWRVREVSLLLHDLGEHRHRSPLVAWSTIEARLAQLRQDHDPASPWWDWIQEVVGELRGSMTGDEVACDALVEHVHEACAEDRRSRLARSRPGVYLGTVHSAKGLEFAHVLVLDGGFGKDSKPDGREWQEEEERRLYYVAMTRAARTLVLFRRRDRENPFVSSLSGPFLVDRADARRTLLPEAVLDTRYDVLSLADIFLDFAGRKNASHPIHKRLSSLCVGDGLKLVKEGDYMYLVGPGSEEPVAALSGDARKQWLLRASSVRTVRVLGLVEWRPKDSGPEYRERCQVNSWYVPWVEVRWSVADED